jgi:hypothetical protein
MNPHDQIAPAVTFVPGGPVPGGIRVTTPASHARTARGVWCVWGCGAPIAVFATADDLARWLAEHGGNAERVTFWPFGTEWNDHRKAVR